MSLVHPDDLVELVNHSFSKLLASLHPLTFEEIKQCKFSYTYRVKRKDNVWIQVLQTSVILELDETKKPLLLLTFASDITLYKKDNAVIFTFSHYDKQSGIMSKITQMLNACKKTSEREKEIIHCIAMGTKTKDIAIKMNISEFTVRAHKRNIF